MCPPNLSENAPVVEAAAEDVEMLFGPDLLDLDLCLDNVYSPSFNVLNELLDSGSTSHQSDEVKEEEDAKQVEKEEKKLELQAQQQPTENEDVESKDCKKKLICRVCGDAASGFHYRVSTCEACKAFFKRTVQGKIEYCCQADGSCKISIRGRKACQACRFQKCLKVGMLKEGVRQDRTRGGRQKYYRKNPQQAVLLSSEDTDYLLSVLMQVQKEEDDIRATTLMPAMLTTPSTIWDILADIISRQLEVDVRGMKQIPGMDHFSLEDQMQLFRGCWSELITFSIIFKSSKESNVEGKSPPFYFAPNFAVSNMVANLCGLQDFIHHARQTMLKINQCGGLAQEEFLLMKALIIANVDCDVDNVENQTNVREMILMALNARVTSARGMTGGMMQIHRLLLLLPSVREANIFMKGFWKKLKDQIHLRHGLLLDMLQ